MGLAGIHALVAPLIVGVALQEPSHLAPTQAALSPRLERTFKLEGVGGPADRTGIAGRLDHMRYDPATKRLFVACVANGTMEAIDLVAGRRVGIVAGLQGPQGVAILGDHAYVTTGEDGRLHRFDARTLAPGGSVRVGDDADNVRVGRDGNLWVSFGGDGPGGIAAVDPATMGLVRKLNTPRMPEGFQLAPDGEAVFANVPAGKRSTQDGSVLALNPTTGRPLWARKLDGRGGNFPMALDPDKGRIFIVSRSPARLIGLSMSDGSVLGEAECPPQSDDLFLDPPTGRVAVIGGGSLPTPDSPGGDGASIVLFAVDRSGRPSRVGAVPLPPHARTGVLLPELRTLLVGVPATPDRPAAILEFRLPD